jgi:hypothetical protein
MSNGKYSISRQLPSWKEDPPIVTAAKNLKQDEEGSGGIIALLTGLAAGGGTFAGTKDPATSMKAFQAGTKVGQKAEDYLVKGEEPELKDLGTLAMEILGIKGMIPEKKKEEKKEEEEETEIEEVETVATTEERRQLPSWLTA